MTGAFFGKSFQESGPLKFPSFIVDYFIPYFLCLSGFKMIKICHLDFPFSGFNLLDLSCGHPFCPNHLPSAELVGGTSGRPCVGTPQSQRAACV